ncbi:MAG: outer membrane beta-barrel protein [Bacteroidota bacterium]
MKSTLILVLICCSVYWETCGQSYSAAVGAAYGDDINTVGVHARGYYNFPNGRVCFGPEFTYFENKEEVDGNIREEISLWEINFNAHFIFELSHKVGFYPVIGANFSHEREDIFVNNTFEEEETLQEWGVNAGAGFHYLINPKWIIFSEWDHLFSDLSQNTFTIGIFYTFGKGLGVSEHKE